MTIVIAKTQLDEPVTEDVLRRAIQRGQPRHRPSLRASDVRYAADSQTLTIGFADQTAVVLPIKNYPELAHLSRADLGRLALGFAGSALCLDGQDLHVSIAGLVSASAPLMAMATTVVASRNGSRSSTAKSIASRENGRKGGRPRKALTML
jgi:hypothetical protein